MKEIPKHIYQPPEVGCPICGCAAKSRRYNKDGTATYRCNFIADHGVYSFKITPGGKWVEVDYVYNGPIPAHIQTKIRLAAEADKINKELKAQAPPREVRQVKQAPPSKSVEELKSEAVANCPFVPHELFNCSKECVHNIAGMYFIAVLYKKDGSGMLVIVVAATGKTVKPVSDDDGFSLFKGDQHIGEVMYQGSKGFVKANPVVVTRGVKVTYDKNTVLAQIGMYGELTLKYVGPHNIGEPSGEQRGIAVLYKFNFR